MSRKHIFWIGSITLLVFLLAAMVVTASVMARSSPQAKDSNIIAGGGTSFDVSWYVIGGGGGTGESRGSNFSVVGTFGQTAIYASSGSNTTISHGFWNLTVNPLRTFLALIKRP